MIAIYVVFNGDDMPVYTFLSEIEAESCVALSEKLFEKSGKKDMRYYGWYWHKFTKSNFYK